jgi:hypothetical protein
MENVLPAEDLTIISFIQTLKMTYSNKLFAEIRG